MTAKRTPGVRAGYAVRWHPDGYAIYQIDYSGEVPELKHPGKLVSVHRKEVDAELKVRSLLATTKVGEGDPDLAD